MARPLRIQFPDAWYHVMNRGRRGDQVFVDKDDYQRFIDIIKEAVQLFSLRVCAYCLMPNHYHLLIQTPDANLSRCMRHINGVYTQRYNSAHTYDGPLFRGRYKAINVDADSYLLQLVRYIHKNPVRAGMVDSPDQYEWSSYQSYLSRANKWRWLYKAPILAMISKDKKDRLKKFRIFMAEDEEQSLISMLSLKKLPPVLGASSWVESIKQRYFEQKRHIEVPQSKQLAPDVAQIKKTICQQYKIEENRLYQTKRGQGNEPRWVAVYLSRLLRGDTLQTIASDYKIASYSTVSSIIERFKVQLIWDRKLSRRVEEIRIVMRQGQT